MRGVQRLHIDATARVRWSTCRFPIVVPVARSIAAAACSNDPRVASTAASRRQPVGVLTARQVQHRIRRVQVLHRGRPIRLTPHLHRPVHRPQGALMPRTPAACAPPRPHQRRQYRDCSPVGPQVQMILSQATQQLPARSRQPILQIGMRPFRRGRITQHRHQRLEHLPRPLEPVPTRSILPVP